MRFDGVDPVDEGLLQVGDRGLPIHQLHSCRFPRFVRVPNPCRVDRSPLEIQTPIPQRPRPESCDAPLVAHAGRLHASQHSRVLSKPRESGPRGARRSASNSPSTSTIVRGPVSRLSIERSRLRSPPLATVAQHAHRGSTRHRDSLASQGLSGLLAIDLEARPGSASDLRGDEVSDRPNGDGEWLASSEDPGRTVEAGNPPGPDHDFQVLAQGRPSRRSAAAMDDLPEKSPGLDRRDGLLRRPDGSLPTSVRLVCARPRAKASSSLQRDRPPHRALGGPTATRCVSRHPGASIPDLRQ